MQLSSNDYGTIMYPLRNYNATIMQLLGNMGTDRQAQGGVEPVGLGSPG
jgi:hypothetical protein